MNQYLAEQYKQLGLSEKVIAFGDKIEAAKLYQQAQDINKITQEIDPRDIADKISELFES